MPTIILDTETTGTDPRRDKIVEIGAVDLDTRATFHAYYNPGIPVPAEATAVHGLTDAFLADKPSFQQSAADFLAFVENATLVAHNAPFDVGFLNAELAAAGRGPLPNPVVDTLALAKRKHPLANNTLDGLCRRYRIDTSKRTKHGALLDAQLLAEVYVELLGRQDALDLVAAAPQDAPIVLPTRPHPLPARLTAGELEAHAAMVAGLSGTIWPSVSQPHTTADIASL